MKKLLKFLLVLNIAFSSWSLSAITAKAATVVGSFEGDNYVVAGEEVTLTYYLDGTDIAGMSGKLSYDSDVLTLTGSQSLLDSDVWSFNIVENNGSVVVYDMVQDRTALNAKTAIFSVTFTVNSTAAIGTSTVVKLINGKYSDSQWHSYTFDEASFEIETAKPVAQINSKKYVSLGQAVADAVNGDTIVVIDEIQYNSNEGVVIPSGLTVTLDTNGHTVSQLAPEARASYLIKNNGTLTIIDSVGTGKITAKAETPDAGYGYGNYTLENNGTLTISSGTVEQTSQGAGAYYAINNSAGATLNVTGGLIDSTSITIRAASFSNAENEINISGGTINSGYYAVQIYDLTSNMHSHLNITGGTITSTDERYNLAVYVCLYGNGDMSNVFVDISGGTFNGNVAFTASLPAENITVSGGVFEGRYGVYSYNDDYRFISGGIFKSFYNNYYHLLPGYSLEEITEGQYKGYYTLAESKVRYDYTYQGETETEYFANLVMALNNVYDDTTDNVVTVLKDHSCVGNAGATVRSGIEVTVDLNGKVVTEVITESKASQLITNKGTLTIKDSGEGGKLTNDANDTVTGDWPTYNYATNVITNLGALTVESGTIENTCNSGICYAIDNNSNGVDAYTTVNGGRIISKGNAAIRQFCNSTTKENVVTVNDGYLEATYYSLAMQNPNSNNNKGSLIVHGGEFEATADGWNCSIACWSASENFSVVVTDGKFNDYVVIAEGVDTEITGGIYVYDSYTDPDDGTEYLLRSYVKEGYGVFDYEDEKYNFIVKAAAFTITYVDGEAEGNPTSYTVEDEDITLIAPVKEGYTFAGWYDEENNKVEVIDTAWAKDITLTAHWYPDYLTSDVFAVDQDNKYICKVSEKTSASEALNVINEKDYTVIKHNGTAMDLENPDPEDHPYVGTGDTADLMHGDEVFKTYQFIVTGDVNGDGVIDVADLVKVRAYILGNAQLEGIYFLAGDVNNDGDVDIADLVMIQAHIIGKTVIAAH